MAASEDVLVLVKRLSALFTLSPENANTSIWTQEGEDLGRVAIHWTSHADFRRLTFAGKGESRLLPLPADAVFGVFEQNAVSGKLVANLVGACKVTGAARLITLGDQRINLLVAERAAAQQFG